MLGFFMIGICFLFVVFNTILIIQESLRIMCMYLRRIFMLCRVKRLRKDVKKVVLKLNKSAKELKNEKNWYSADKLWF